MSSADQSELIKQRAQFGTHGYLILPKLFDDREIDTVQAAIDRVKKKRPLDVVIDDLENGDRTVLGLMPPEDARRHRMKVNDLHLTTPKIRDLALAPKLIELLRPLLGHPPALCNSLYLNHGSAQAPHVDALYMTPHTPGHLIAVWVALENVMPTAGPLEYFAGSHRIEQMRFSDGRYGAIPEEMNAWEDYMRRAVSEAGLEKSSFAARKGDVFIWHAHLLHGGGTIADPALTRKSLVFHYFSERDARQGAHPLVRQSDAFWIEKPPLPLPHEVSAKLPFSETAYLARYPDVANAVASGAFASGQAHYDQFGRNEGRLPN